MNKKAERYLLKVVENNYEEIAEDFNISRQKPLHSEVLEILKSLEATKQKILDLGCGNGRLLEFLPDNIDYLGVDNSKKLLDLARQKYKKNGVRFVYKNILNLDQLEENNFNLVFCLAVFHHLPGDSLRLSFLNKIYDKIDKDGLLVISVWKLRSKNRFNYLFLKSFLKQFFKGRILDCGDLLFRGFRQKSQRYYHAFSKRKLKKIFQSSKFKIKEFREDKFNFYIIAKK
ncbi:MAG: methyltransferase domain-containing protein [Patescibacteria group bacterium]|jgi:SAM-dependent methyltransferase